jgi:hypothetical protein
VRYDAVVLVAVAMVATMRKQWQWWQLCGNNVGEEWQYYVVRDVWATWEHGYSSGLRWGRRMGVGKSECKSSTQCNGKEDRWALKELWMADGEEKVGSMQTSIYIYIYVYRYIYIDINICR